MAGFPIRDGSGPLPDSGWEVAAWVVICITIAGAFAFFSGLDSQAYFLLTAPGDYLLSADGATEGEYLEVSDEQIEFLNAVSRRSVGLDSVAGEKVFCADARNGVIRDVHTADFVSSSTTRSVSAGCVGNPDVIIHTQPAGSAQLSAEDKSFSNEFVPEVTCIQFAEVAASPLSGQITGLRCWRVERGGDAFVQVTVLRRGAASGQ
jgi:hypothetical protein